MGMFDSSPATGVTSPTASARPAGVRGTNQMPGSPLMHQPPMSQMQGVVGGTGGGFGVGGIGAPRPSVSIFITPRVASVIQVVVSRHAIDGIQVLNVKLFSGEIS